MMELFELIKKIKVQLISIAITGFILSKIAPDYIFPLALVVAFLATLFLCAKKPLMKTAVFFFTLLVGILFVALVFYTINYYQRNSKNKDIEAIIKLWETYIANKQAILENEHPNLYNFRKKLLGAINSENLSIEDRKQFKNVLEKENLTAIKSSLEEFKTSSNE